MGSPGGRGWAVSQFANDHFRQTEITFKWINWCLIFSLLKEAKREIDPSRALNWAMAPMTQEPNFHSGGRSLLPAATWRSRHHPLRSSDFPSEGAQWNLTPRLTSWLKLCDTEQITYLHWPPNRTHTYTQLTKWVNKAGTLVVIQQTTVSFWLTISAPYSGNPMSLNSFNTLHSLRASNTQQGLC